MALKLLINDLLSLPNSLVKIPQLEFGVSEFLSSKHGPSTLAALTVGYRHLDFRPFFGEQEQFKDAMEDSGLQRSDVFVASRSVRAMGNPQVTYNNALDRIANLVGDGGYVDLEMVPSHGDRSHSRKEMYQALETLLENGKIRSLGVRNWGIRHLEELKSYAKIFPPHVVQLELHPFCQQRTLVEYCRKEGIVIEANCPQIRNRKETHFTLKNIASYNGTTVRQLLIRYSLQKGWVPILRADIPKSIQENADVYKFEISKTEMDIMDRLDEGRKGGLGYIPE